MSEMNVGLSELPDGWIWTTVGSIGLVASGKTPKGINDLDSEGEIPFYKVNDMNKSGNEKFMRSAEIALDNDKIERLGIHVREQGTVIFPKAGGAIATNKKRILSCPSAYDLNIMGVLPYIVPIDFFYQWLLSIDLATLSYGSNVPQINHKDIDPLPFPLPPLPEQHRIVTKIEELFTKLDAGINELHKAQSQLKRYRQSVLKAAFEGKLTEAWRAEHQEEIEPASVLLNRILKERRKKWEAEQLEQMKAKGKMPKDDKWKAKYKKPATPDTNALPKLPKGWIWATVEQLLTKIQYGSSKKTGNDSNDVPVLRMGNIVDGKIVLDNLKYLPKEHDEFPELLLDKGDLLFNRTNSRELVGKTAVYTGIPDPCSFASYLIRVRFNLHIDSMIVTYYINSVYGKDWILSVVSQQAGQANVNGTKLKLLAVPMPPEKEQQILVEEVERRFSVADEVEKTITAELKRAEQLRQSILKKAFSGKLVPQDPNDEPASVLLERIKAQKEISF